MRYIATQLSSGCHLLHGNMITFAYSKKFSWQRYVLDTVTYAIHTVMSHGWPYVFPDKRVAGYQECPFFWNWQMWDKMEAQSCVIPYMEAAPTNIFVPDLLLLSRCLCQSSSHSAPSLHTDPVPMQTRHTYSTWEPLTPWVCQFVCLWVRESVIESKAWHSAPSMLSYGHTDPPPTMQTRHTQSTWDPLDPTRQRLAVWKSYPNTGSGSVWSIIKMCFEQLG